MGSGGEARATPGQCQGLTCIDSLFDWLNLSDGGRQERISQAGWLSMSPEQRRFDDITRMVKEVFDVPVCAAALFSPENMCCFSTVGIPSGTRQPRFDSFCNYVCVPPKPEVLVVENVSLDARYAHNPFVKGEPAMLFYAAAPLVGAGGMRYGTLCVIDFVPRAFTAEMYRLLLNCAELIVLELESDQELFSQWTREAMASAQLANEVYACISSATEGVALVDTRRASWEIKYANEKFAAASDGPLEDLLGKGFWHMFQPSDEQIKFKDITNTVAVSGSRTLVIKNKSSGASITVTIYPASTDQLTPGKPMGVPSWVPSERDPAGTPLGITAGEGNAMPVEARDKSRCMDVEKAFYFVAVQAVTRNGSMSTSSAEESSSGSGSNQSTLSHRDSALTLPGLSIGPLIGSGSFGIVYRANYNGQVVAAKMVRCLTEELFEAAVKEAKLGRHKVQHPNVVQTIAMDAELDQFYLKRTHDSSHKLDAVHNLWIVQELCDRGTLADAVERGWMRTSNHIRAPPDMDRVYRILRDIADGMAAIHAQGIVHCNLNGRNVMLASSTSSSRGFVAKVADFGQATMLRGEQAAPCLAGARSHLPPELALSGKMSPSGDVWAFGIIMWEVISGHRAHCGPPELVSQCAAGASLVLEPPAWASPTYGDIMAGCMREDPATRPSFAAISWMLKDARERDCAAQPR